ncbi:acyl-CoA synthetase (AMP-forming)/AMP-acid ligase II [Bradyrhizobium sp. LB9.1b]
MSERQNQYNIGLDKTPANYVPLSPLSFLARSAAVYPDHVSTVYEGRSFTWRETHERCKRFASWLANKGIGAGDTVAAMLPNIPAMNEAHFAVPMTGAVLNALNIRLDAPSIAFQLDHGGARIILVDPEFSGVITDALAQMTGPKPFVIDVDDAAFTGGRRIGEIEYESAVAQGDPDFAAIPPGDEWDAIALSYTSGTTGNPKGVVTHHRGAISECRQQYPRGQSRPASGLSLDAADVPLQRVVFPLDYCCRRRRQCLLAQGRADQNLRADQAARRHPHVRRADRL